MPTDDKRYGGGVMTAGIVAMPSPLEDREFVSIALPNSFTEPVSSVKEAGDTVSVPKAESLCSLWYGFDHKEKLVRRNHLFIGTVTVLFPDVVVVVVAPKPKSFLSSLSWRNEGQKVDT